MRQMVLELNASDDRGIDVVREQIKTFASTKQIFASSMGPNTSSSSSIAKYKLIILDEADAMTSTAQMALRRIMEKYTANTRFCVIANYTHKLSPALLSRCTRFRFSPLKEADIRVLVDKVIEEEGVIIEPRATDALVTLSKGDMRRALNVLQACFASSECHSSMTYHSTHISLPPTPTLPSSPKLIFNPAGTPLHIKGTPKPRPEDIIHEPITESTIYTCIATPDPSDISTILSHLLKTPDVTSCLSVINSLKVSKGLALADILTELGKMLAAMDVPAATMITWLDGLAEIEYRLSGGGNEVLQTGAVVGVVRGGVELMG